MGNQFEIPEFAGEQRKFEAAREREREQLRPPAQQDRDMAAVLVFSSDFTKVVTLYASRFHNRKFPSGREDLSKDESMLGTALRELSEETRIVEDDLILYRVCHDGEELETPLVALPFTDPSRSKTRFYFVGVLKDPKKTIESFNTPEDDTGKYVSEQRLVPLAEVLRDEERAYNTMYSIALAKALIAMQAMPQFADNRDLRDTIHYDLGRSGLFLTSSLEALESRQGQEEEKKRQNREYSQALRQREFQERGRG